MWHQRNGIRVLRWQNKALCHYISLVSQSVDDGEATSNAIFSLSLLSVDRKKSNFTFTFVCFGTPNSKKRYVDTLQWVAATERNGNNKRPAKTTSLRSGQMLSWTRGESRVVPFREMILNRNINLGNRNSHMREHNKTVLLGFFSYVYVTTSRYE